MKLVKFLLPVALFLSAAGHAQSSQTYHFGEGRSAPQRGGCFAAAIFRNRIDPQAAPSTPYDAPFAASEPVLASLIRIALEQRLNGASLRGKSSEVLVPTSD